MPVSLGFLTGDGLVSRWSKAKALEADASYDADAECPAGVRDGFGVATDSDPSLTVRPFGFRCLCVGECGMYVGGTCANLLCVNGVARFTALCEAGGPGVTRSGPPKVTILLKLALRESG